MFNFGTSEMVSNDHVENLCLPGFTPARVTEYVLTGVHPSTIGNDVSTAYHTPSNTPLIAMHDICVSPYN